MRAAQSAGPAAVPDVLLSVAAELGATDVVIYLVDFAQTTLEPIPDRNPHPEVPQRVEVASTMAGRAFVTGEPVTAARPDGVRVWVPVVEGSDRTGVLALTVAELKDDVLGACSQIGLFAGYLIATHARTTDLYNLYRRRRSLSLAASMQWDLLPPLVLKSAHVTIAALVEPAYEVGGDCFDYALGDMTCDLAVIDAMGHGVSSALIAALAIGSYRHDRREGRSLRTIHTNLDEAVARFLPAHSFATGQLARIELSTGAMTWTNAGHPLPLLIRRGRVIGELTCPPTAPWGIGAVGPQDTVTLATEALEPGDGVLFYTDGVTEAHSPGGELFGVDKLADLVGQHASTQFEPEEILRYLIRAVLEHQDATLTDDATLVLLQWNG